MAVSGTQAATPPMQPSVDDTALPAAASAEPGPAKHTGFRAFADKFMSSGTLFSPIGAVAATTSASVANSMVKDAISGVGMESAYMNGMVQNFTGRSAGFASSMGRYGGESIGRYGAESMGRYGAESVGRYGAESMGRYGATGIQSFGRGATTQGMFGRTGTLALNGQTFSEGMTALKSGLKAQIGIGAAIGAVMSLITNIHGAVTGQISKGDAAGNIATDTVSSGISAAGGALLGGFATVCLGAVGIAGLPLTLIGIGAGLIGGIATDSLFRHTKIASGIHDSVAAAFT
jgi:hypothetical protein